MKIQTIAQSLAAQSFFNDMAPAYIEFISGCAHNVHFRPDEFLMLAGKEAKEFFLIKDGRIALEMEAANKLLTLQTAEAGAIVGWSWLIPPYTWHYDARAVTEVSAVSFDAVCVREKCESDPAFGYQIFKRFCVLIVDRLITTHVQLSDVYQ